ncbi:S9 family peptidase [Sanguibacteroides justesenii]|uniref:Peptidase S9 n=1 Tax=Sanguibacteroides justesenii TaxID=1547597 RepID=A0AB34R6Q1_9PORP|nr:DPP IV N-terminal domain-containing protein [Sanguibacteroides justesenii]KIO47457.1 peptidase S9 [Sanguibacteroides justesenii]
MIKNIVLGMLLLAGFSLSAQQKANYKLADRFTFKNFRYADRNSLSIYPEFINDGDCFWFSFTTEEGKKYYYVDPAKREKRLLFDTGKLLGQLSEETRKAYDTKDFTLQGVEFDKKRSSFTFVFEKNRYRYDMKTGLVEKVDTVISKGWGESWKKYSPDSSYIVYAKNHNLFLMGNKEKGKDTTVVQLTTDGEKYYTYAKEEADTFPTAPVAVWLKDSKRIFAVREDMRNMKEMGIVDVLAEPRPKLKTYKYSMPGDQEAGRTEMVIIDVETKEIKNIDIQKWNGEYFSVLHTSKNGDKIFFERRPRTFDEQEVGVVDTKTGEVKVLIHEVDKPFMDYKMANIMFLNDGKDIIYRSERTGWGHYYLYDGEGNFKHAITSGAWVAGPVSDIDTVGRTLYFYGLGIDKNIDPYYYTLCKVDIDKPGSVKQLTFENATHMVHFPKSYNYFVDIYNRVDMVPRIVLKNKKGKELMELARPDIRRAVEMGWKAPERFKVKAADGVTDLYGVMWKPFDFDSTKQYPIISSVYPGPFYEYVPTQFALLHDDNTRLAQLGFIVIAVGHRGGTPMRGKFYHTYSHGRLRDYPLADDKYAIEQLADRYSFIDGTKVGIYGHSGGGFMSTAAICTYPDFYSAAVSSAGNHDNNIYNSWWGEVHHGVKEEKKVIKDSINGDRTESTFKFSVPTNMQLAKNYKGGLLLIHGWVDDNVHPAHTLRMADALIRANKNFDMIILPAENHGFGGAANTFYERKMWFHFAKHLLGDETGDFYYEIEQYKDRN